MMTTDTQQAVVRELFDAWNAGVESSEIYDRIFAPDFVCHGPPGVNHSHEAGSENCVFYIFNKAFEDLKFEVTDLRMEDERVLARFRVRGRQVAPFRGIQPRDEERQFEGITIFRIADGRVAEGWGSFNSW
jgi:predicted ester cyclase